MDKKQAIEFLENNDLDIQSSNAALFFTDMVYSSYANSHKVNGVEFGPVFCFISYKKFYQFFQFASKENIDNLAKKMYTDYK